MEIFITFIYVYQPLTRYLFDTDYSKLVLDVVVSRNEQPLLSLENIYNGKPRNVHLEIVQNSKVKEDNDNKTSVDGDANKSNVLHFTATDLLHEVKIIA